MFLIAPSKSTASATRHAPFMLLSGDRYGTEIDVTTRYDRTGIFTIALESITTNDGLASFNATSLTNNVTAIAIGNSNYSLAIDSDNPTPGEYLYNYRSNEVKVYLKDGDSLERDTLTYESGNELNLVKSTDICGSSEPLLARWNATADSLTLNDAWGQLPGGFSFGFVACESERSRIKTELCKGTLHYAFNNRWVVSSLTISETSTTEQIVVGVGFAHWLSSYGDPSQSPLDKPIKLKKDGIYTRSRTLASFAAQAGIAYKGAEIRIRIPRETKNSEHTTLRSLLGERAITAHSWVRYTSTGIELVRWSAGATHVINEEDLKDKNLAFSYGGSGSVFNGVKLAVELRNKKVKLDFDTDNQNLGVTEEWEFEGCNNLFELYNPVFPDANGTLRSLTAETLRNMGYNFDRSEVYSKTGVRTIRFNGTITFQQSIKTGLAFASSEVYETVISPQGNYTLRLKSAISPANYFGVVEQSTSDWRFSPVDGYLNSIVRFGTETSRLKQETEKLEAITYKAKAIQNQKNGVLDPDFIARSQAYEFNRNRPINDVEVHVLNKHSNYYSDTVRPEDCEEVEAKFLREKRRLRSDSIIEPDPDSTKQFTLPPVVSARVFQEFERKTLTSTEFPQKYETIFSKTSLNGQQGRDAARDRSLQFFDGKPSPHTRLDLNFDQTQTEQNPNRDLYGDRHFYISSPNVHTRQKINEGSIGYADIDDPNEVKAIATTQNSIDNTRACLTTEISIHYRQEIKKGDFAILRGKRYKIFGVNDNRQITRNRQKSESFKLTLGLFLSPSLELEDRTC